MSGVLAGLDRLPQPGEGVGPSSKGEMNDLASFDSDNPPPLDPDQMLPIRQRTVRQPMGDPRLQGRQPAPKHLLKDEHVKRLARWLAMKNVADEMTEEQRDHLSADAKREFTLDDETRAEWKTKYKDWLNFALQVSDPKTYPWPNASNVIFPLITVAALQFNARAYPAIVQGRNVVKGTVIGDDRGVPAPATVPSPQPPPGAGPGSPGSQPPGPQGGGGAGTPPPQIPPGVIQGTPPPAPGPGAPPPGAVSPGLGAPQPAAGGAQPPPQGAPSPWLVPPGLKQARADRIGRHMSWQLLTEMPEWEGQTDRLLIVVAIAGTMFRKNYYDPGADRNVSETVDALRVCVNYKAKSFEVAPRVTEEIDLYPWEIESNIRAGLWLDQDYGHNNDVHDDPQAPVTFCEQQRRWDLDGDGYAEPLIVTFARDSGRLARVVPLFDEDGIIATPDGEIQKITPIRIMTKYGFIPNPDGGVYDIGFGHLLYPLNAAINTTINQMFDAGHLQNAGGGFIGGGMSVNAGSIRFTVGEYKVVNTPGQALRQNIVPLEFPGPNAVLLQLMQFLVEAAKEIASINDVLSGELPGANVPGILGLAVIQQGLKVFNAIFKRIHRSLRGDFEQLFRLNRRHLPDEAGYAIGSEYFEVTRADYEEGAGVEPVSDPDMVTDAQQMAQANFLSQFLPDPFFDGREIRLRMLNAAAVPSIDKLLAAQAPPNAELAAKMAELDIADRKVQNESRKLDLEAQFHTTELAIRAQHEQAELAIQRGKDKAVEIRELSQAILNLANAKKADAEVNQQWYDLHLGELKHQVELINTLSAMGGSDANPGDVGGDSGGAAGAPAGLPPGGLPSLAASPGLAGRLAVPAGLSG
jgi:chaperonin GroES